MVDSRAKGSRGEYIVRDLLRKHSDWQWERVPMSGALSYLKGDLYVPNENNRFCIEVKNYQDSPINDKIFTNKSNNLVKWWGKLLEQSVDMQQEPLLFIKYNRSKVFVCTEILPANTDEYMLISWLNCYILLAENWLEKEKIKWVLG